MRFLILLTISFSLIACTKSPHQKVVWQASFPNLGSSSSPRCIDLNGDEIFDCVIGAGLNEFDTTDSSVIALNGKDGSVLWAIAGSDQVVGTPTFVDLSGDGAPDVVIGGRGAQLYAINGRTGKLLWQYQIENNDYDTKGYIRFNFYTPQILEDVNNDLVPDILVSNGGNFAADPVSGNSRYPGVLAILSGANGAIIAADTMPDGRETYMSPLIYKQANTGQKRIVYGSGGETFGGHLYQTTLANLLSNNISESTILLARENHGFIAPPTVTDITSDGFEDLIVNWHGGEMIALDGVTNQVVWQQDFPDTEVYASPTPGDVNDDKIPDFFTPFTLGAWPKYTDAIQVVIDGKTGSILYQDTIGCASFSSALAYDTDNDGSSEFIYSTNDYNCRGIYLGNSTYSLRLLDINDNRHDQIIPTITAKNQFSTPWIGDMDQDSQLDLVFCIQSNYNDVFSYYGMQVVRMDLNINVNAKKSWTQYLGLDGSGVY